MNDKTNNPLSRYFRVPGVHVQLPTSGHFLPEGTYHPTVTGEVPVLPMRAADEILLKSPDALMSGYAVEKLVESCVPAISAPAEVSTPDLDVLLLAIRAASFGPTMDMEATCPKCSEVNAFAADLGAMLATARPVDPDNPVRLSDEVIVHVKPYTLGTASKVAALAFAETRRLQQLDGMNPSDEERARAMASSIERMSLLNIDALASCIVKVVVPEGEVTDRKQIFDFISNVQKAWIEKLDNKLKEINAKGIEKTIHVSCAKCGNEWTTEVEFDPAGFFGAGS